MSRAVVCLALAAVLAFPAATAVAFSVARAAAAPVLAAVQFPDLPAATRPSPHPTRGGGRVARPSCPVAGGATFSDTWGAPRDGGHRQHKGVDMFAPAGTRLVTPVRARVVRAGWNRLGGNGVTLRTPQGTELYYAHLQHPATVAVGQQLRPRQELGQVGNTGNATTTPSHLHLEVRPGGRAVNPTPYARGWC